MSVNATRDAVARILRDNGVPEPYVLAGEIEAIFRGHGWRPTNVVPLPPPYQPPPGPPLAENVVHAYAKRARDAIKKEDPHDA